MASKPQAADNPMHYKIDVSVDRNGRREPAVVVTVNGNSRQWETSYATNHIVFYLAIIECLSDAIMNGGSDVVIEVGDQTARNQLNGRIPAEKPHMRVLMQAVQVIASKLPSVEYV